ncbi:GNAT family N-acetyltransferase [Kitasatospora sp. NPDC006697]|uniref:GNAT family N-acetyltransferase n=1 Tax=Kitasatospora sp. NPDC006697 TaxID=3364020 RepID=UPI00369869CF
MHPVQPSLKHQQPGLVRLATERDLGRLERIDQQIFPEEPYPFFVLRQLFEVHGGRFLVLEHQEELAGYALLATTPDHAQSWVLGLGVLAQLRNLGYGRQLMEESIALLTADRVGELRLSVDRENTVALHIYRSLGFTLAGERPDYFGPGDDRLILRLPLRP